MNTARISLFDRLGIIGATVDAVGDRFRLGDVRVPKKAFATDPYEDLENDIIDVLLEDRHARPLVKDGIELTEIVGSGGRVLGDDLSSVRVVVVGHWRDRGSFARHHTTYHMILEFPDDTLVVP